MTLSLSLPETLIELPPTQDELPDGDGIPMETFRHKAQMDLLTDLDVWLDQRSDGFAEEICSSTSV